MSLQSDRGTVLVTDSGRGSALAIIRSLGRAGYRVIAADCEKANAGFRSRYVSDRLLYPDPLEHPEACIDALLDAARTGEVDLILPVTDAVILPLSAARDRFSGLTRLALPQPKGLEVVTNKELTVTLATRLGVPTPRTHLVHSAREAQAIGDELGWPLVLKPQTSRKYEAQAPIDTFTVAYAQNSDDLCRRMEAFEGRCGVLLQEYCAGEGHGVELLLHEGRPLAAFQHRRLREVPITGGASAFRESVPLDPVLLDYSLRLMGELRWTGLAMVEFKSSQSGPRLMEINGRVWGSLPLAVRSGMDFPRKLVDLYLDGPSADPELDTHYRHGVRARNLQLDLVWMASVLAGRRRYPFLQTPKRAQGLAAAFGLLHPRSKWDAFSADDPLPCFADLRDVVETFRSKMREPA